MFLKELQKINFSNEERFSCIDVAYNDFLNKLMKVGNEIAPSKESSIKNNTDEWFDREIAKFINSLKILFLKFKNSKLHFDEEITKK